MGSSRMSYKGSTSATMKNRVEPKTKQNMKGQGRIGLEAVGPNASGMKGGQAGNSLSYKSTGQGVTAKGYPRGTFVGSFKVNKPNKVGNKVV